jgi:prepilin-type N-terminal cleavage/methylation domain-containing protein
MRRGFTLMEVLISVLIFSIVSIAMIGVLTGAVKIFRAGETARAAHDDAVAVLAQLDDDLALMVPPSDGGFLYARVHDTMVTDSFTPDPYKSMVLAFKIRNPNPQAATADATSGFNDTTTANARLIVCWYVDKYGDLNRSTGPATEWYLNPVSTNPTPKEITVVANDLGIPGIISKKCLYFGVDLSLDQAGSTRQDLSWTNALPVGTSKFCTEPNNQNAVPQPFPRALRVTLTLTGGSRNLLTGSVVSDSPSGIKITGVGQVPLGPGAVARIGDPSLANSQVEWVTYDAAARGLLTLAGARPTAIRRTGFDATNNAISITHSRGEPVVFGSTYSLVRTLPR